MNGETFLYFLIGGIVGIIVFYFFMRWVFSVDKQLKNQKMMIFLLKEIALKNGVEKEEIEKKELEVFIKDSFI